MPCIWSGTALKWYCTLTGKYHDTLAECEAACEEEITEFSCRKCVTCELCGKQFCSTRWSTVSKADACAEALARVEGYLQTHKEESHKYCITCAYCQLEICSTTWEEVLRLYEEHLLREHPEFCCLICATHPCYSTTEELCAHYYFEHPDNIPDFCKVEPGLPDNKTDCEAAGYYWYDNACHMTPKTGYPSACLIMALYGSTWLVKFFPFLRQFRDQIMPSQLVKLYYDVSKLILSGV